MRLGIGHQLRLSYKLGIQLVKSSLWYYLNALLKNPFVYIYTRCDCYILKDILNNWSDEASNIILNNLFAAVTTGNRVLIIERVLHTGGAAEEVVRV